MSNVYRGATTSPVFPQLGARPATSAEVMALVAPVFPQVRSGGTGGTVRNLSAVLPSLESLPQPTSRQSIAEPAPDPTEELEALKAGAMKDGYRDGFDEGLMRGLVEGNARGADQGRREARAEFEARMHLEADQFASALQAKVNEMNSIIETWFAEREGAMADLAMEVVRGLLSSELQTSRNSALAITREALAEITHGKNARVRLNPFDVPILHQHRADLLAASSSLRNVDLIEDPSLLGGCIIETEGGVVDASLDTRLVLLENAWDEAA